MTNWLYYSSQKILAVLICDVTVYYNLECTVISTLYVWFRSEISVSRILQDNISDETGCAILADNFLPMFVYWCQSLLWNVLFTLLSMQFVIFLLNSFNGFMHILLLYVVFRLAHKVKKTQWNYDIKSGLYKTLWIRVECCLILSVFFWIWISISRASDSYSEAMGVSL